MGAKVFCRKRTGTRSTSSSSQPKMRLPQLACVLAALAAACASPAPAPAAAPAPAPGRWRFDEAVAGGGTRQARRIAAPAADAINVLSPAVPTSTTPAPRVTKKLVTLAPGGNNIQDILFNNGYRDRPADAEPQPNNIDNDANLGSLDRRDAWLLDGNLLVLKGGAFSGGFSDTAPIDDFQAAYRQPKFPPPEFLEEDELPPGLLAAWQYGFPGFADPAGEQLPPPLGPEGTLGYQPYGRPESRPESLPEFVAGPHSNVGAQPYAGGQPFTDGRPYTDGQPYAGAQPYTGGQPCTDDQPYTSGQPHTDAQPYVDGKPYTSGQPYVDVQPYVGGQPYAGIHPYTDRQPFESDTPNDDSNRPINPELMQGYSPLGRPEPRPDSWTETQIETRPETPPETKLQPEARPESAPQPIKPYNGQSYGERRQTPGGGGGGGGGGWVRFPVEAPSVGPQLPPTVPSRTGTHTYSVRASYSSTSSQSSTSVMGHNARYLPPPRSQRRRRTPAGRT